MEDPALEISFELRRSEAKALYAYLLEDPQPPNPRGFALMALQRALSAALRGGGEDGGEAGA